MNNIHVADDGYAVWTIPVNGGNNDAPIDVHINQWVMREKIILGYMLILG